MPARQREHLVADSEELGDEALQVRRDGKDEGRLGLGRDGPGGAPRCPEPGCKLGVSGVEALEEEPVDAGEARLTVQVGEVESESEGEARLRGSGQGGVHRSRC